MRTIFESPPLSLPKIGPCTICPYIYKKHPEQALLIFPIFNLPLPFPPILSPFPSLLLFPLPSSAQHR